MDLIFKDKFGRKENDRKEQDGDEDDSDDEQKSDEYFMEFEKDFLLFVVEYTRAHLGVEPLECLRQAIKSYHRQESLVDPMEEKKLNNPLTTMKCGGPKGKKAQRARKGAKNKHSKGHAKTDRRARKK